MHPIIKQDLYDLVTALAACESGPFHPMKDLALEMDSVSISDETFVSCCDRVFKQFSKDNIQDAHIAILATFLANHPRSAINSRTILNGGDIAAIKSHVTCDTSTRSTETALAALSITAPDAEIGSILEQLNRGNEEVLSDPKTFFTVYPFLLENKHPHLVVCRRLLAKNLQKWRCYSFDPLQFDALWKAANTHDDSCLRAFIFFWCQTYNDSLVAGALAAWQFVTRQKRIQIPAEINSLLPRFENSPTLSIERDGKVCIQGSFRISRLTPGSQFFRTYVTAIDGGALSQFISLCQLIKPHTIIFDATFDPNEILPHLLSIPTPEVLYLKLHSLKQDGRFQILKRYFESNSNPPKALEIQFVQTDEAGLEGLKDLIRALPLSLQALCITTKNGRTKLNPQEFIRSLAILSELKVLSLSGCSLYSCGMHTLLQVVATLKNLRELDLQSCGVWNVKELSDAMLQLRDLRYVNLRDNDISDDDIASLKGALKAHPVPLTVDLGRREVEHSTIGNVTFR